ncbi:MAG: 30S ribosomal protein S15 [Fibrobacter sp.]|nr:30S ribosomal protein S15 [Fibrobacter sp.]
MALTKERKQELTKEYGVSEKDTGNSCVQTALLTERISQLTAHLRNNPKDHHTRNGLLKMVGKRRALLDYIAKNDIEQYRSLIKKLGIRK